MTAKRLARQSLLGPLAVAITLSGCASTDVGQRSAGQAVGDSSSVEASLMRQSELAERRIRQSGARITDPELNAYIDGLTRKISGDYAGELRVYLVEAPVFNAGIYPNGAMMVFSGLMLRADSEAELAQVLGHEFGHYVEQHSLKARLRAETTNNVMTLLNIATLGYGGLATQLIGISNFYAYTRENETEADLVGLRRAADAGYDPKAAPALWNNLLEEKASSSNKRARKRSRKQVSGLFDTHPLSSQRVEALRIATDGMSPGQTGDAAYRARIRPYLLDWFEAELGARDFGSILTLVERKRAFGEDLGVLGYVEGRAYDLRRDEGDGERAVQTWTAASAHADAPAQLYRELGNTLQKLGRDDEARAAFQTYLMKAPNAPDAALVRSLLG